jgi:hypothetical protein
MQHGYEDSTRTIDASNLHLPSPRSQLLPSPSILQTCQHAADSSNPVSHSEFNHAFLTGSVPNYSTPTDSIATQSAIFSPCYISDAPAAVAQHEISCPDSTIETTSTSSHSSQSGDSEASDRHRDMAFT